MNSEKRKEYNKNYYINNRPQIIAKALNKVVCKFCERPVIFNNLVKHQTSSLCKRKTEQIYKDKLRLQELQNEYNIKNI